MLMRLAISCLGAFVFLRIVAKEKNRRERHLLARLAEYKRLQEEQRQKEQEKALAEAGEAGDAPTVTAAFTGRTAAA